MSLLYTCHAHEGALEAAKLTLATIDILRCGGITASIRMKLLIIFAGLGNLVTAFSLAYIHVNTLSTDDWWDLKVAIFLLEIFATLNLVTHPLLYFGRYDAILFEHPRLILILKSSWLLPIGIRIWAVSLFLAQTYISTGTVDWIVNVVYALVGLTANGISMAIEMAIIIFSDVFILYKMKTLTDKLGRPFYELIGASRLIRIFFLIVAGIWAVIFPFFSEGDASMGLLVGPIEDFTQAIQFSVLLDFYELDLTVFKNPTKGKTGNNVIGSAPVNSVYVINGLTTNQSTVKSGAL